MPAALRVMSRDQLDPGVQPPASNGTTGFSNATSTVGSRAIPPQCSPMPRHESGFLAGTENRAKIQGPSFRQLLEYRINDRAIFSADGKRYGYKLTHVT